VKNLRSTLATVWRIAAPYFRSEDRFAGWVLLASVISIELSLVGIDVLLNQWRNRFYNALQERNWEVFVSEIGVFTVLAGSNVVLVVYQLYLNQWLQIRWRRWLTSRYLGEWLHDANHYRMQLQGDAADNPDQRITDDVKLFIDRTLDIGVGLLSAVVTLGSFVFILWGLSAEAPLHISGRQLAKCVLLRQGNGYLLAVLPAAQQVDLEGLRQQLEKPIRLATAPWWKCIDFWKTPVSISSPKCPVPVRSMNAR